MKDFRHLLVVQGRKGASVAKKWTNKVKYTLHIQTIINYYYFIYNYIEPTPLFDESKFRPYDSTQEPIFPPELKIHYNRFVSQTLMFESENMKWFRPVNIQQLLQMKKRHPDAKIVVGNTELGVEMKFKNCKYPVMILPNQVGLYFLSLSCSMF